MRRRINVVHPCLLGSVLVAWLAVPARGDVALESYSEQRPLDADHALAPLKAALERHHVVTNPALILEMDAAHLPLPGNPDRDITRTKLIDRIDRAINRAAHEAYDDAATILEGVFRDLDHNPALAAADPESRSWITKGRVALAFSYVRSKRQKLANDVIVEHLRSYPELSLKGEQEEVERLYSANLTAVGMGPRGTLVFRVNLADAAIFVNDVERGRGTIEVSLIPGAYRIVVRATGVYRHYQVTIHADETVERSIDWAADAAFTATPDWIGFVGPRSAQRSVTTFVQQLVQRSSAGAAIVVGIAQRNGRRYLTAKRYAPAPALHRPGRAVELGQGNDGEDPGVEAIAAYVTAEDAELARLPPSGLLALSGDDELAAPAPVVRTAGGPARWPVLAAAGVLGTSIPFGAYLLKTHNDCFTHCSAVTAPAGWGMLGLGSLALGFGIVWIVHSDRAASSSPVLDVRPVPGGGIAYLRGSF